MFRQDITSDAGNSPIPIGWGRSGSWDETRFARIASQFTEACSDGIVTLYAWGNVALADELTSKNETDAIEQQLASSVGPMASGPPDGSADVIANTLPKRADALPDPPAVVLHFFNLPTDGSSADELRTHVAHGSLNVLLRCARRNNVYGDSGGKIDPIVDWLFSIVVSCCEPYSSAAMDCIINAGYLTSNSAFRLLQSALTASSDIEEMLHVGVRKAHHIQMQGNEHSHVLSSLGAGICTVINPLRFLCKCCQKGVMLNVDAEHLLVLLKQLMCLRLDERIASYERDVLNCIDNISSLISEEEWQRMHAAEHIAQGFASVAHRRHWAISNAVRVLIGIKCEWRMRELRQTIAKFCFYKVRNQDHNAGLLLDPKSLLDALEQVAHSLSTEQEEDVWRTLSILRLAEAYLAPLVDSEPDVAAQAIDTPYRIRMKQATERVRFLCKPKIQRLDCILVRDMSNHVDRLVTTIASNSQLLANLDFR